LEIVMATANRHKLEEANYALREFGVTLVGQDIKGTEIQSMDPIQVARSCLLELLPSFGRPLIVEDTALSVKALNGFPGALASDVFKTIGNRGILKLLEGEEDRSACFEAAVAYGLPPDRIWVFTGRAHGTISLEPKGDKGFGFDPIFIPNGHSRTFGEMTLEEKGRVSHRALAFRRLGYWVLR
jgi:XTP/dITP diphosphohydrolase